MTVCWCGDGEGEYIGGMDACSLPEDCLRGAEVKKVIADSFTQTRFQKKGECFVPAVTNGISYHPQLLNR